MDKELEEIQNKINDLGKFSQYFRGYHPGGARAMNEQLPQHLIESRYLLDGKTPVQCKNMEDVEKSYELFESEDKIIAKTRITNDIKVSTVFLVFDHNTKDDGVPVLFETMIFAKNNEELNGHMERYTTWDDAVNGHQRMIEYVNNYLKQK